MELRWQIVKHKNDPKRGKNQKHDYHNFFVHSPTIYLFYLFCLFLSLTQSIDFICHVTITGAWIRPHDWI